MKLLFSLLAIGLLLGGCANQRSFGSPRLAYAQNNSDVDDEDGYRRQASYRGRGAPNCGADGKFSEKFGKCIGKEFHDIELSAEQKATFASCERIETRTVMRGDRLVQQQRGINCQRPK